MTDATFSASRIALTKTRPKNYNPNLTAMHNGFLVSETFIPTKIKMILNAKNFLAVYVAFRKFEQPPRPLNYPVIVFKDNKTGSQFSSRCKSFYTFERQ